MEILSRLRLTGTLSACGAVMVICSAATPVQSQSPVARPEPLSFEVASIKPNRSGAQAMRAGFAPGGRLTATNVTVRHLLQLAYGADRLLYGVEMLGGPGWLDTERFDVEAKADAAEPSRTEMQEMTRALLADRFTLVAREERREQPVYHLTLAGGPDTLGPQLRPSSGADCRSSGTPAPGDDGVARCGTTLLDNRWTGRHLTMDDLAGALTRGTGGELGRLVVNSTGLSGGFSFELDFDRAAALASRGSDLAAIVEGDPAFDGLSIVTALQEQLGLKLERGSMLMDVLVIESAERPTEN